MSSKDFTILVPWILAHGYLIFLVIAIIEGPFITIAGGIAAGLGYYNIYIVTILSVIGDIGGDVLYYFIGYKSRNIVRSRFFKYLGVTEKHIEKIEALVHTHIRKAVLLVKFSPVIGPLGHIIIGTTHASFKKFFETAFSIALPKSIFFALIGYFSVKTYLNISKTITHTEYIILILGILIILIYFLYIKFTGRIVKKLE